MSRELSTPTSSRWLLLGGLLVAVLLFAILAIVALSRGGDGTEAIDTTTTTTRPADVATTSTTAATEEPEVDESEQRFDVGGRQRSAVVISPLGPPPPGGFPVVMVLHGLGVSARSMSNVAPWRAAVERDAFVAVFPQGVENSWNLGRCCAPASVLGIDDVEFLGAVVDEVAARPELDAERLYLTGFSNGALMAYAMACERPGAFAAVAPMAGSNISECLPDVPVSLLHQHSDVDLVVPYGGGVALGSVLLVDAFPSVPDTVSAWAEADGCASPPQVVQDADVERTVWQDCADGTRVELVRVPGVGHRWLRRGDHDPLEAALEFFGIA